MSANSPEAQPQGVELLPCPFCGKPPFCKLVERGTVAAERSYTGSAIDVRVYELGCINDLCVVCPKITGGLAGIETLWNTRAALPALPEKQQLEAANAAATEICDYCGIDTNDAEKVAAIISRYVPAEQPEVADLIETCFSQGSNYAELKNKPEDCPYADGSLEKHWWTRGYAYTYRILRAYKAERKFATARADAIGEAIEAAKAERLQENLNNDSDREYTNAIEHVIAALEQLKEANHENRKS